MIISHSKRGTDSSSSGDRDVEDTELSFLDENNNHFARGRRRSSRWVPKMDWSKSNYIRLCLTANVLEGTRDCVTQ